MSITLRPDHERTIAEAIASGAYESADQVIDRALELLRSQDAWLEDERTEISEKIDRAFAQFERSEFFSAEESRVEMEKRKSSLLAERTG